MVTEVEQIEKATKLLQDSLNSIPVQIERLQKELMLCDQESSDLLHLIEFSSFHASEGYKLCRDLQITRQRRRTIKNELETLNQIKNKLVTHRPMEHQTQAIEKVINRRKAIIENSTYTPKVRSDLVERFNKCNKSKLLK